MNALALQNLQDLPGVNPCLEPIPHGNLKGGGCHLLYVNTTGRPQSHRQGQVLRLLSSSVLAPR